MRYGRQRWTSSTREERRVMLSSCIIIQHLFVSNKVSELQAFGEILRELAFPLRFLNHNQCETERRMTGNSNQLISRRPTGFVPETECVPELDRNYFLYECPPLTIYSPRSAPEKGEARWFPRRQ
ncbi:unnamed protein product [Danaus chrysippus]|uniref:(African queen) hypothetical protein n=1 Tax=Danaus chrysippus TaxID=151541 RepID=A0A8J2QF54_9NEOP|nr:unnamed protein product [Danaus chrysippus]